MKNYAKEKKRVNDEEEKENDGLRTNYAKLATVGQIGLQSNQGEVDVDLHKDP